MKREPGFYFIRRNHDDPNAPEWEVALYSDGSWYSCLGGELSDWEVLEIDERKIERNPLP